MAKKFLIHYFPHVKIIKLRIDISFFLQIEFESLYNTWESYKELVRKCPQHNIVEWMQIKIFYNGLNSATKQILDATSWVSLCSKQLSATQSLIQEMETNGYLWSSKRNKLVKWADIYEVNAITTLAAQVEAITKRLDAW